MGLLQLTFMIVTASMLLVLPALTRAQTTAGELIKYSQALLEKDQIEKPENVSHELTDTEVTVTCHIREKDQALKIMNEAETLPDDERERFILLDLETIPVDGGNSLRDTGYLVIYKREKY